jgi:hemerythrin-like domain-containing protein
MDAFQLLKEDHRKVEQLFSQLESASGKAKLDVFKQIKTELDLHTHIEEKIFYPALEEPEETHDLALEAYEEHAVVKTLLKELSRARTANDEWEAQAKVLQENVEHHVEEEENELFQKADSALSDEELEDLTERMIAEKSRKARRPAVNASAKKSSGSKKSAGKSKSASKNASASKGSSRSAAAKTARRSRSKKSAAKKR